MNFKTENDALRARIAQSEELARQTRAGVGSVLLTRGPGQTSAVVTGVYPNKEKMTLLIYPKASADYENWKDAVVDIVSESCVDPGYTRQ